MDTLLELKRRVLKNNRTLGSLFVDGNFFCFTIEDKVRSKFGQKWNKLFKVYAKTAIPYGTYPVLVTWSNRFQRMLTGIFNVPDFEGIRIHNGTTELSSAGCVIVSYLKNADGTLVNDKKAMNDLCDLVEHRQKVGKVRIIIT